MGVFNVAMGDKFMTDFCKLNDFSRLIDKPTCYFQHSNAFETGPSDFHLLTVKEFKMGFQNLNPLSANPTKWSNTLKQFVGKCRRIV